MAVTICEDAWEPGPIVRLVAHGAEVVVNINASPYYAGRLAEREAMLELRATQAGVPVSTTHAITGAIVGVGATRRMSAVRWGVAGQIVWAWILTIPAAFTIAAGAYTVLRLAGAQ